MLLPALFLGLVSSLHCMGMCGPIAMMLPVDHNNPAKKASQILLYHLGRITAYAALGMVFGLLGKGFYLAGMQQQLSILAGAVMITIAIVPERIFAKYNFSKPVYRVLSNIKTALGSQFRKRSYKALFVTGLLNGFLPCGLVYAALFGALAMPNIVFSVSFMALYGLGTIPLMSAAVYTSSFLKASWRSKMVKVVPVAAACIGILFILRGLGLGIPFVSPGNMSLFIMQMPDCR